MKAVGIMFRSIRGFAYAIAMTITVLVSGCWSQPKEALMVPSSEIQVDKSLDMAVVDPHGQYLAFSRGASGAIVLRNHREITSLFHPT